MIARDSDRERQPSDRDAPSTEGAPAPAGAVVGRPTAVTVGSVTCAECEIGTASTSSVQFCPFIIRHHEAGEVLCRAGDPASYIWSVKEGVVGMRRPGEPDDRVAVLRLPGAVIGLEAVLGSTYAFTATVIGSATLCGIPIDALAPWLAQDPARLAWLLRAGLRDPLMVERFGGV